MFQTALYARVSTSQQAESGTIESQLATLQAMAAARAWTVSPDHVFVDDGVSGSTLARRGLDALRDAAALGELRRVLVLSPDRLARRYAHQVLLVEELQRYGCQVIFEREPLADQPAERLLQQVQGIFAEYERTVILERLRRGRLHAARQGQVPSRAPYGYVYVPKTADRPGRWCIQDETAAVVRQMFHWLVEEELKLPAIVQRLNQGQIPTPKGQAGWSPSTVSYILRNSAYAGTAYYNRDQAVATQKPYLDHRPRGQKNGRQRRPESEWIAIEVPAIIEPETFKLAQMQLARNRDHATRHNTKHPYLLRTLLVCGFCQHRLAGSTPKGQKRRYVCPQRRHGHCAAQPIDADLVEQVVWDTVDQLLRDPALLAQQFQAQQAPTASTALAAEERRISQQLARLTRKLQRLIAAYEAEAISLDELQQRRRQLDAHRKDLEARQRLLERQRAEQVQVEHLLDSLESFCQTIEAALENPTFEDKRRILELVIDQVVVEDGQITIHHILPLPPSRLCPNHLVR
jgi:site-specific DNA recombinase